MQANREQYLNLHVLISHSPSCLNRDDMNMQKTAVFGGATRVRISSQSLKRAMRESSYYKETLGTASIRTRDLGKVTAKLIEELEAVPGRTDLERYFPRELIEQAAARFVADDVAETAADAVSTDAEAGAETDDEPASNRHRAVAPWIVEEIREICRAIKAVGKDSLPLTPDELAGAKDKFGKYMKSAKAKKDKDAKAQKTLADFEDVVIQKRIADLLRERAAVLQKARGSAVDVAMSGRMATSGLMSRVDGALAMAHAITTHAVEPQDNDWFTAVDDLTIDAGEAGAGHLNNQQFSSGVFYRHASINLKQLQFNMGLIGSVDAPETVTSRQDALRVAASMVHMLATVVPSAKQNNFAAHNVCDLLMVSFGNMPISLANAFERPITSSNGSGYLEPSAEKMTDYWSRLNRAYSLNERCCTFSPMLGAGADGAKALSTLAEATGWVASDGVQLEA